MKNKLLAIMLALIMALAVMPTVALAENTDTVAPDYSWYTNHTGDGDYIISSAAQLIGLANIVNGTAGENGSAQCNFSGKTVKLGGNIDLSSIGNWTPIGTLDCSKCFSGTFDGNNHTISGLKINKTDASGNVCIGLFSGIQSAGIKQTNTTPADKKPAAKVCNLTLDDVIITINGSGDIRTGALCGCLGNGCYADNVTIKNVTINATTSGTGSAFFGGLSGFTRSAIVSGVNLNNIKITSAGTAETNIGGASGFVMGHRDRWNEIIIDSDKKEDNPTIYTGCSVSEVEIKDSSTGTVYAGGFAGDCTNYNNSCNSYFKCTVSGLEMDLTGNAVYYAGGFMGYNHGQGKDEECSAEGTITCTGTNESSVFGGFIGGQGGRNRPHNNDKANVNIKAEYGRAGGFVGITKQYLCKTDHQNKYTFDGCTAEGDVTCTNGTAAGFAGESGCYGGDGHQIWVDYTGCEANGNVSGNVAAGFIGGIANNSADFTGENNTGLTVTNCNANGTVLGTSVAAGLIASVENKNSNCVTPVTVKEDTAAAPLVAGASSNTEVALGVRIVNGTNENSTENGTANSTGVTVDGIKTGKTVLPSGSTTITMNNDGSIMLPNGGTVASDGKTEEISAGGQILNERKTVEKTPDSGGNIPAPAPVNPTIPTPTPTPYKSGSSSSSSGNTYSWYFNPTPSPVPAAVPVPVEIALPKTGDMTIWQSILSFLGIE